MKLLKQLGLQPYCKRLCVSIVSSSERHLYACVNTRRCFHQSKQGNSVHCKTGYEVISIPGLMPGKTLTSMHGNISAVCGRKFTMSSTTCSQFCGRSYCSSSQSSFDDDSNGSDDDEEEEEEVESSSVDSVLDDNQYRDYVRHNLSMPDQGHRVFLLHIVEKTGSQANIQEQAEIRLLENEALVDSIPAWSVECKTTVVTRSGVMLGNFLSHETFSGVAREIRSQQKVTALVISTDALSAKQTNTLQHTLGLPVFNRTFMIIQAFKSQARSREARALVALAELPHLKFQFGLNRNTRCFVNTKMGSSWLQEREKKLKAAVRRIQRQQNTLREHHIQHKVPTVAVIGYTNSGKTSLIKAMTGDVRLVPEDRLFATVDVTRHSGRLPNLMTVLYVDTMGFISDLPARLKPAFNSTLQDTLSADLVVHVIDACHPYHVSQRQDVITQVEEMLSQQNLDTMIHVYNKVDRLDSPMDLEPGSFHVSALTSEGMDQLEHEIEARLLHNLNYLQKNLRIPLAGQHLRWLHTNATVVSTATDRDPECIIAQVQISRENYQRFLAYFSPQGTSARKQRPGRECNQEGG